MVLTCLKCPWIQCFQGIIRFWLDFSSKRWQNVKERKRSLVVELPFFYFFRFIATTLSLNQLVTWFRLLTLHRALQQFPYEAVLHKSLRFSAHELSFVFFGRFALGVIIRPLYLALASFLDRSCRVKGEKQAAFIKIVRKQGIMLIAACNRGSCLPVQRVAALELGGCDHIYPLGLIGQRQGYFRV